MRICNYLSNNLDKFGIKTPLMMATLVFNELKYSQVNNSHNYFQKDQFAYHGEIIDKL